MKCDSCRDCDKEPEHKFIKEDTVMIDGCSCAVVDCREDGTLVYDWELLVHHFLTHEGMGEMADEDDDPYEMAAEWVDYNVYRGIMYISEGIRPDIVDYDGRSLFAEAEDEEKEDCLAEIRGDMDCPCNTCRIARDYCDAEEEEEDDDEDTQ